MDYGGILKRTWEITWRNKALWILGILASCNGGGRGGAGGGNFSGGNFRGQGLGDAGQAFEQFADNETFWVVVAIAAIVLLGLSLLFLALGVIGQGGLIAAFHKADQGVTLSLAEAFRYGVERFWRMLGLQIIVGLVFLVLFLILLLPILAATVLTLGVALICLLPLLCLLIPLGLTVPIFLQFAQMAIVVEGRGIMDSIRRAWEVIRGNVGPVLVMGLILVVGSFFAQTLFALPLLAALAPLFAAFFFEGDTATAGFALAGLCFLGYLPVLIGLGGVLQTYVAGAWTLSYLRWIERPASSDAFPTAG